MRRESIADMRAHFRAVADLRDDILAASRGWRRVNERLFPEEMAQLMDMLEAESLSRAYDYAQGQIMSVLIPALGRIPDLAGLVGDWPDMSPRQQIRFLDDFAALMADVQSRVSGIRVESARLRWSYEAGYMGEARALLKDGDGRQDMINLDADACQRRLSDALSILAHEQTHIFQAWLARAVYFQDIGPFHPLYRDGLVFKLKQETGAYIGSRIDSAYWAQIEERDARRMEREIGSVIRPLERRSGGAGLLFGVAVGAAVLGAWQGRRLSVPAPG